MNAKERTYKIIESYWMLWVGYFYGSFMRYDQLIVDWNVVTSLSNTITFILISFMIYWITYGWFEDKNNVGNG